MVNAGPSLNPPLNPPTKMNALPPKPQLCFTLYSSPVQVALVAVATKTDRTAWDVRYIAAGPNGRKCRDWNRHGHVTTLPWLFQMGKFRRFVFSLGGVAERYIVQQKCL